MKAVDTVSITGVLAAGLFVAGVLLCTPPAAAKGRWIVDPVSRCATTSAFSTPGESIRWYGECRDGKLHGRGTLIWYNGQIETERNEGTFQKGEMHGDVLTTFPDGRAVYGQYWTGVRHGYFLVMRADRQAVKATYKKGRLIARQQVSPTEALNWQTRWQQRQAAARQQAALRPASRVVSPARQAAAQPQAATAYGQTQSATTAPEPERRSFWSRINPLNWGVVGFFSGLFGGGADETATAAAASAPQVRTASPAPRAVTPRPAARAVAPAYRPLPMMPPQAVEPAAGGNYGATGGYGTMYDMRQLLDEPHPFARGGTTASPPPAATGYRPISATRMPPPAPSRGPQLAALGAPQVAAAPAVPLDQAADNLFLHGYGLESAGDRAGAAAVYQQVIRYYPATRSASHARARLGLLQRTAAPAPVQRVVQRQAAAPAPAQSPSRGWSRVGGGQIVTANSPFPQAATASAMPDSRSLSMFTNSPWLQRNVCSRKGIYAGETGWCGRVLRDDGSHLLVEVHEVRLFGFGTIGISRSTCTGGTLLTWFSRGTTIRVPKQCLTAAG